MMNLSNLSGICLGMPAFDSMPGTHFQITALAVIACIILTCVAHLSTDEAFLARVQIKHVAVNYRPGEWFNSFYFNFLAKIFYGFLLASVISGNSFLSLRLRVAIIPLVFLFLFGQLIAGWLLEKTPHLPLEHAITLGFAACLVCFKFHPIQNWLIPLVLIHSMIQFIGMKKISRTPETARDFALINSLSDPGSIIGAGISQLRSGLPQLIIAAAALVPYVKFTLSRAQTIRAESHHPWVGPIVLMKMFRKQKFPPAQEFIQTQVSYVELPSSETKLDTIKLLFAGDYAPKGRPAPLSSQTKDWIRSHDLRFFNLEAPIWNRKKKWCPKFLLSTSPQELSVMLGLGDSSHLFNVASVVNNHAFDRGNRGRVYTRDWLRESGISTIVEDFSIIQTKHSFRIGALGRTFGTNLILPGVKAGVLKPELLIESRSLRDQLRLKLRSFKDQCDFLILSYHWGHEGETLPSFEQKECWRILQDMGVDLLYGHHSHLPQPFDLDDEGRRLCLYSCGNLDLSMPHPAYDVKFLFSVHLSVDSKNSTFEPRIILVEARKPIWDENADRVF